MKVLFVTIIVVLATTLTWNFTAAEVYQASSLPPDDVIERNLAVYLTRMLSHREGSYTCQLVGKRQLSNNEYEVYFETKGRQSGFFRSKLMKLDNNKWILIATTAPWGNEMLGTQWLIDK